MNRKIYLNREDLERLYIHENKSLNQIAREIGVEDESIRRWMLKYKIPRRGRTKPISLVPSEDLGYFCGVVIGDGSIMPVREGCGAVSLQTHEWEFANLFKETARRLFPALSSKIQTFLTKPQTWRGYTIQSSIRYSVVLSSIILYNALRPYKQPDSRWEIPKFLTTLESHKGFLQGIFDADGSVSRNKYWKLKEPGWSGRTWFGRIVLSSKHRESLEQVQELLFRQFGTSSKVHTSSRVSMLQIGDYENKTKFYKQIGFRLERKMKILAEDLENYATWSYEEEEFLQENWQGMSDIQIAKEIGRTQGAIKARRLKLRLLRQPVSEGIR